MFTANPEMTEDKIINDLKVLFDKEFTYADVKITINLNKLVEARAKLLTQYGDYSEKIVKGEYLDGDDISKIASKLRDTLSWESLYSMIDKAVLEYVTHSDNQFE